MFDRGYRAYRRADAGEPFGRSLFRHHARGGRGYGDKAAVTLPNGKPVLFNQPLAAGAGELLPFHPTAANLGLQFIQDLPHDWPTGQGAFNGGSYDQWVPFKGTTTMAYLRRDDTPFHDRPGRDAYHCSTNTSTDPNRYYMWTGYVGNDGTGGGPVIDNAETGYVSRSAGARGRVVEGLSGRRQRAGRKEFLGLDRRRVHRQLRRQLAVVLHAVSEHPGRQLIVSEGEDRHQRRDGRRLFPHPVRQDVQGGTLPQVSWIVAPEAFSEHPNWPANYGACYVDQVLQVLTSNPDLWSKTALLINYDENDGFFDYVVPAFPPLSSDNGLSTVDVSQEIYPGSAKYARGVYGLGARVPMLGSCRRGHATDGCARKPSTIPR